MAGKMNSGIPKNLHMMEEYKHLESLELCSLCNEEHLYAKPTPFETIINFSLCIASVPSIMTCKDLLAEVRVPGQGLDVHKHGPAGIGHVGHMFPPCQFLHHPPQQQSLLSLKRLLVGVYPYDPCVHSTKQTAFLGNRFLNF